jgi:hypothetical protein
VTSTAGVGEGEKRDSKAQKKEIKDTFHLGKTSHIYERAELNCYIIESDLQIQFNLHKILITFFTEIEVQLYNLYGNTKDPEYQSNPQARCQWLMPIILAIQEVKIRGSRFEVSSGK